MNIVESICQKYPVDYFMMPDGKAQSVSLDFASDIDIKTQDQITEALERLGIFLIPMGALALSLELEREGVYALKRRETVLFRFADHTDGIYFYEYNPTEAIAWVIYMLSIRQSWLDSYKGQYISCKVFSARQQVVAERFMRAANHENGEVLSEALIESILKELQQYTACFAERAPRFSARPIQEKAFRKLEGKQDIIMELERLSDGIFGTKPFPEILDDFHNAIKKGSLYQKRVQEAVQWLIQRSNKISFNFVSTFFTELQTYIHRQSVELPAIDMHEKKKLSFTSQGLKDCFESIDKIYLNYIKEKIQQDFMNEVCEKASQVVGNDLYQARRGVAQTRGLLQMFCFINDSFGEKYDIGELTWKQLISPTDKDLFVPHIGWDADMLHDLQSTFISRKPPAAWLSSERLKYAADQRKIAASLRTHAVPIMDEQYVWAVWADPMVD